MAGRPAHHRGAGEPAAAASLCAELALSCVKDGDGLGPAAGGASRAAFRHLAAARYGQAVSRHLAADGVPGWLRRFPAALLRLELAVGVVASLAGLHPLLSARSADRRRIAAFFRKHLKT